MAKKIRLLNSNFQSAFVKLSGQTARRDMLKTCKPHIALVALSCLSFLFISGCWDTGSGEKVGQIIRLNRQGVFCKTWEAELIRGGLNNGSGAASTLFTFTIEDERLVPAVKDALDQQYEVKIHYNMEGVTYCRSDGDDHFLNGIEKLSAPGHPLQLQPQQAPDPKEQKRQELLRQLKELERLK
jgi:hypothetical protein